MNSRQVAAQARNLLASSPQDHFTQTLLRNFDVPVIEYMASLRTYRAAVPMEAALGKALRSQLLRVDVAAEDADLIVTRFASERSLQTIAHTTLSNGPGFLGANWLAAVGLPTDQPCVAATFSGIPFSNECRPGCLNFSLDLSVDQFVAQGSPEAHSLQAAQQQRARDTAERRHSLVPEMLNRSNVFGSSMTEHTRALARRLVEPIARHVPDASMSDDFPAFALRVAAAIDSAVLERRMVYVDFNALIADYLIEVLPDDRHPVARLLFDGQSLDDLGSRLGPISLFSRSARDGARFAMLYAQDSCLVGKEQGFAFTAQALRQALQERLLCPGLFLSFFVLAFINGFQCFGGFDQVRYLPRFRAALAALPWLRDHVMKAAPTDGLTLGRARAADGSAVYPIDALFGHLPVFDPQMALGEFAAPTVLRRQWLPRQSGEGRE